MWVLFPLALNFVPHETVIGVSPAITVHTHVKVFLQGLLVSSERVLAQLYNRYTCLENKNRSLFLIFVFILTFLVLRYHLNV